MKKLLKSCSICFIIVVMLGMTAFAAQPAEPQSNSYIAKTTVSPVALGNGVIEVDCGVTGTGRMEKIGISRITLYKADGTRLESHSYTESGYGYLMGYNTFIHNAFVPFQCVPGESYYAVVGFYAGKGNGAGGHQMVSAIIKAK